MDDRRRDGSGVEDPIADPYLGVPAVGARRAIRRALAPAAAEPPAEPPDAGQLGRASAPRRDEERGGLPPPQPAAAPRTGIARFATLLVSAALVLQLAVIVVLVHRLWARADAGEPGAPGPAPSAAPSLTPTAPAGPLLEIEKRTSDVFRKAAPSVVYITTLAVAQDPFRRDAMAVPRGTGSGFIWDRRGHVVTNFHVIAGANAARVTLADGSVWPAKLVGEAADKDLAVLHIEAGEQVLAPLGVGSSADLVVGQQVLAIGNPFGLDHTLSTGVISGLGREITSMNGRPIQGVIQTDAAINPGNSGGPLLDSSGRLVGVNTAIYSPSGASAGIGFAVPVDTVNRVVTQLIAFGKLVRPALGIQIAEASLARRIGVKGVLVVDVVSGSPADQAGLRPTTRDPATGAIVLGDVILSLDGQRIGEPKDLFRLLDGKSAGQSVRLTVLRGREQREIDVELAVLAE